MHPTNQISDAELINAIVNGNEKALEALVVRYKDRVYTTVYMLVKDRYLAEELFQEAFLKIILTIREKKYREEGKFLPWALRIAHNLCMDHFRKVKSSVPVLSSDGTDISDQLMWKDEVSAGFLELRETHRDVRKLIEMLPVEQREVIVLRMYGNLNYREIADMMGVGVNTALGRMRYALINLRKMIEEHQVVLR